MGVQQKFEDDEDILKVSADFGTAVTDYHIEFESVLAGFVPVDILFILDDVFEDGADLGGIQLCHGCKAALLRQYLEHFRGFFAFSFRNGSGGLHVDGYLEKNV